MAGSGGAAALAALIRREQAEWADPVVDQATFGDADPVAISAKICAYADRILGAVVDGAGFYRVSVGCVAGVRLDDGRGVVIKVRRDRRSAAFFAACHRVLEHLRSEGFPCPEPLAEPIHSDGVWWTCERLLERGERRDAHDPAVRRTVAGALAEVVRLTASLGEVPGLFGAWFSSLAPAVGSGGVAMGDAEIATGGSICPPVGARQLEDRVWPKPHSPLFDFDATKEGAEWIDALAARARAKRHTAAGADVIGHFDWRVEHLRFEGDRVVASYDWDSLHWERETVMVGAAAHAFTADWQREGVVQVPSLEEMRGFVDDYEDGRGRAFSREERRTIGASLVYSLAYTARCNHADREKPREEGWNGDFRPVLREVGEGFMTVGI